MSKSKEIINLVLKEKWLENIDNISFLASGEYNENYVLESSNQKYLFRINHGSQLSLRNQISYEYLVLQSLANSGYTPKPYFVKEHTQLGGVMLMQFLPGESLEYKDSHLVPPLFAKIHKIPINSQIIVQADPILDIAQESLRLINRYPNHPLTSQKKLLLEYYKKIVKLQKTENKIFLNENLCIVNSEVNSGNFLVDGEEIKLVDWEKAVVSYRYQDLAHFLVPTTTLWKTDFIFSDSQQKQFLLDYFHKFDFDFSFAEFEHKTKVLEKTILLRALSWCYMGYYEYQNSRSLSNNETKQKIEKYLKEIECFLK